MSAHLRQQLLPAVLASLQAPATTPPSSSASSSIDEKIKQAFLTLDADAIDTAEAALRANLPLDETLARIKLATAGSCALLALYDPLVQTLRIACVGDSRAVLCRTNANGHCEALPVSVDQTGFNDAEVERVKLEHPGEDGIIKDGRILNIAVSRGFGDGFWKWPADVQEKIAKECFNGGYARKIPFDGLKTPPYLTAEPVITTTEVGLGGGEFLILASDGFWDHVSNEQAARLVREWIDWRRAGMPAKAEGEGEAKVDKTDEEMWRWGDGCLTVVDDNCATHLVRNVLGGADERFLAAVLGIDFPKTRLVR